MSKKFISPQQDAGWGLIFRLNDLWRAVERYAPNGKYDDWNFTLDRIWCNLLYREEMDVIKNSAGEIINIKLNEIDKDEKVFLDKKIAQAKAQIKNAKEGEGKINTKENNKAKREYYDSMMLKDIWVRKLMNKLGLYLKEIERDPSKAIYGG